MPKLSAKLLTTSSETLCPPSHENGWPCCVAELGGGLGTGDQNVVTRRIDDDVVVR